MALELKAEDLCARCSDGELPPFVTTKDLEHVDVIGQERAVEALLFSLDMPWPDYNAYILGPYGVGKRALVSSLVEDRARREPTPQALCYVHNFAEPERPRLLRLPPGRGVQFRDDMAALIDDLRAAILAALEGDEFRARQESIDERYAAAEKEGLLAIQREASAQGVAILQTPAGVTIAPIRDEKPLPPEEFEKLSPDEQAAIRERLEQVHHALHERAERAPLRDRDRRAELRALVTEVTTRAVSRLIDELRTRYADLADVAQHLEEVSKRVVQNAEDFLDVAGRDGDGDDNGDGGGDADPNANVAESRHATLARYRVNVLVDHVGPRGAPVVWEDHPTLPNLLGRVEYASVQGNLVTNFLLIRPGALHRAHGGYLILDALRLIEQPLSWEALKRAIQEGEIRIESPGQVLGLSNAETLEPQRAPAQVKVILLGDRRLYDLLATLDAEFRELFKVAVDFNDEVDRDRANVASFSAMAGTMARRDGLRPLERAAVARLVEDASRRAEDARKLSVHLQALRDLLRESDAHAATAGASCINKDAVNAALLARERRAERVKLTVLENIRRGVVHIDVSGRAIGQVNALSVTEMAGSVLARPSRVTAKVWAGRGRVIDIEREAELSGPIHAKGVLILQSFLASRFARDRAFRLRASVVFEQSYGLVEGDSASMAELCALLSALSGVPILQSRAMTGSVDQMGWAQAVGAVNDKVEGFFDAVRAVGPRGDEGVIIPERNQQHLMLRDDVVAAVADGRFHIWVVQNVDEAIEALTGVPMKDVEAAIVHNIDAMRHRSRIRQKTAHAKSALGGEDHARVPVAGSDETRLTKSVAERKVSRRAQRNAKHAGEGDGDLCNHDRGFGMSGSQDQRTRRE